MKICPMEAEYFMRVDGWTDGRAQTAGSQTVGQTDRQTDRKAVGQRHGQTDSRT
jgi:hypothetical protein